MYISTFYIIAYYKVEAEVSSSQAQSGPDNTNDIQIISHENEDMSSPNKGKLTQKLERNFQNDYKQYIIQFH